MYFQKLCGRLESELPNCDANYNTDDLELTQCIIIHYLMDNNAGITSVYFNEWAVLVNQFWT